VPNVPNVPNVTEWALDSWASKTQVQVPDYEDRAELDAVRAELRRLPPLVTSWEIERLRACLAEAQEGKRFLLQGGDCAEVLADCRSSIIANKLKILLQMSLAIVHGSERPVIRVARLAGQYAKPRSSPTERRGTEELPSYFGDMVNGQEFTAASRRPDAKRLLTAYHHAALTLNFVRSLAAGGFADLRHPEYWDLPFFHKAAAAGSARSEYEETAKSLAGAFRLLAVIGEKPLAELTQAEFFMSHEGLNLHYESALTHTVPRREGYYDLSTHLPWIGNRTRELDHAHVEFFRGVRNPVAFKIDAAVKPDDVVRLVAHLNPRDEPGKVTVIARMGASKVAHALAPIVRAVKGSGRRVLWVSDPMHGNTRTTRSGHKTRDFAEILQEVEGAFEALRAEGAHLGGVHFEFTGEDVTECVGGTSGVTESDLGDNYTTGCDPRLNYRQALEMGFLVGRRLRGA
jgi:3-deoxy-7-phosphoheptulonate synthase